MSILIVMAVGLSGCAAMFDGFSTMFGSSAATSKDRAAERYGSELGVMETADIVRSAGTASIISSRALKLPNNPMHSIEAYDYEFPVECGGHRFRVYRADNIQILEYAYPSNEGGATLIRDYISGPSPFVQPGLWNAYDHTGGSVAQMSLRFESSGDGILEGTYSQGPVTGLDLAEQRTLGLAYDRAIGASHLCKG